MVVYSRLPSYSLSGNDFSVPPAVSLLSPSTATSGNSAHQQQVVNAPPKSIIAHNGSVHHHKPRKTDPPAKSITPEIPADTIESVHNEVAVSEPGIRKAAELQKSPAVALVIPVEPQAAGSGTSATDTSKSELPLVTPSSEDSNPVLPASSTSEQAVAASSKKSATPVIAKVIPPSTPPATTIIGGTFAALALAPITAPVSIIVGIAVGSYAELQIREK